MPPETPWVARHLLGSAWAKTEEGRVAGSSLAVNQMPLITISLKAPEKIKKESIHSLITPSDQSGLPQVHPIMYAPEPPHSNKQKKKPSSPKLPCALSAQTQVFSPGSKSWSGRGGLTLAFAPSWLTAAAVLGGGATSFVFRTLASPETGLWDNGQDQLRLTTTQTKSSNCRQRSGRGRRCRGRSSHRD